MTYIVDLDDFYEKNSSWELLLFLKTHIPKFKVTLFTIPGRCSRQFIESMRHVNWIDMVTHGWMHRTSHECRDWSAGNLLECLQNSKSVGITSNGFKAPGWIISRGCYEGLLQANYWVADQPYNNYRRPKDLPAYLLDSPNKIHGHIGGNMENELSKLIPHLLTLKEADFKFVREVIS